MSEKFERKYKALLSNRYELIGVRNALIVTLAPILHKTVQQPYSVIQSWMDIASDLQYLEQQIVKHSVVELDLVKDLLKRCYPEVSQLLNDGEGFENVDAFVARIGELKAEYNDKLAPILNHKRIMNLLTEIHWIETRVTLCKINANSLSGSTMDQPIDTFKSRWFMGGGKKKDEQSS